MSQKKRSEQLARREFLSWFYKITGGVSLLSLTAGMAPLRRINTTLFSSSAYAGEPCTEDICTERDACEGDEVGHTCQQRDVCEVDESGDCTNDECTTDSSDICTSDRCGSDGSGACNNDGGPTCPEDETCPEDLCSDDYAGSCVEDSSLACTNDSCESDASGECQTDVCRGDASGECTNDECWADSSGFCETDSCTSDSAGSCTNDECESDKSGECENDNCTSDNSGGCGSDVCVSDTSGGCVTDNCTSDSSNYCETDACKSDSSGECTADTCISDSSGICTNDECVADSSGLCETDTCVSDKSGDCVGDACRSDSSGGCTVADRCNSDYSGECGIDVCVLDASSDCDSDLCREDRTPVGSECTTDTCTLDLASNRRSSRRQFARAGINKAIKLLYKLCTLILFLGLTYGQSKAQTVINSRNAVFYPAPTYDTSGTVTLDSPVGPFLRDCDHDGILEMDVNGDGECEGDPEVMDYDGDGTLELPPGTAFTGDFEFTCFYVPHNVAIISTGPLTIETSDVVVLGVMRLGSGAQVSSTHDIDLRASAWLSEDGSPISFVTALSGEVDSTQIGFTLEECVPEIHHVSIIDSAFVPRTDTIAVGDSVRWINDDSLSHTSTSDGKSLWDSGTLDSWESFTFQFETDGVYPYHCEFNPSMIGTIVVKSPTAVREETGGDDRPSQFALSQNYPNPFNQSTKIRFTLAKPGFINLEIYDILGRKVKTLVSQHLSSGYKSVLWDGKDNSGKGVASGIYFYQLRAEDFTETKRLLLLK